MAKGDAGDDIERTITRADVELVIKTFHTDGESPAVTLMKSNTFLLTRARWNLS
jgi:hypothetical protein